MAIVSRLAILLIALVIAGGSAAEVSPVESERSALLSNVPHTGGILLGIRPDPPPPPSTSPRVRPKAEERPRADPVVIEAAMMSGLGGGCTTG